MARPRFLARIADDEDGLTAVDPWRPEDAPVPFTGREEPGAYRPVRISGGVAEPDGPRFATAGSGLANLVALAAREGVDPEFPAAVSAEVEATTAPRHVPYGTDDPALDDLRDVPFVTIDNEDSRDLDQALHLERDGQGTRVRYALADAAYYVRPGTALFAEALARQASYYLPGWMIPMLPRPLCEDLVSLNPLVPRRALVFDMRVTADGRVRSTEVRRAVIRSHAKLSYPGVQAYLDAPNGHPVESQPFAASLKLMPEVGRARMAEARERHVVRHRRREVEVGLTDSHSFVVYGSHGNDVEAYNEQISLLTNMEGARLLADGIADRGLQAIFRVHPPPDDARVRGFRAFVEKLARSRRLDDARWRWRDAQPLAAYLRQLPEEGDDGRIARAIQRQAILLNVRSSFSDAPAVHHGVGADAYARFSAPMREMVGVFLHKELLEHLGLVEGGPASVDESLRERIIEGSNDARDRQRRLTRRANHLALDQLFRADLDGAEPPVRDATVMGLTRSKIHLSLDEPPVDVKLYRRDAERFAGTALSLSEDEIEMRKEDGSAYVRVGDRVRVRVVNRDPDRDRWILRVV